MIDPTIRSSTGTNRLFFSLWIQKSPALKMWKRESYQRKVCVLTRLLRRFPDILLTSKLLAAASLIVSDEPSTKMWTLSLSHSTKHDEAMADRWKSDMDGILVYVRFMALH
jgi:hypothetical protein